MRGRLALGILLGTGIFACTAVPAYASGTSINANTPCPDTAHYLNSAHTGLSCSVLSPAARELWSVTLSGTASYPIIADGMVFETTTYGASNWLYALNGATGKVAWPPVPLAGTYSYYVMTYDNGRLFVDNFNGTLVAFNAANGSELWSRATSDFSGEPVATAGVVYVQSGETVYAISESNGAVLWQNGDLDGDGSALAVDTTGVYVNAGCSQFRLSLQTGAVLWSKNSGCFGGGGGSSWLTDDKFFSQTGSLVFNETTGATDGTFAGTPAFDDGNAFIASGNAVFSETLADLTPRFTTELPSAVVAGPVIASGVVYVGCANSRVYEISTTTGKLIGAKLLPGAPGGGVAYSATPSDMGIGQNLLVVPTGAVVSTFGTVSSTGATVPSGQQLGSGQTITSSNSYKVVMQRDGNLVEYAPDGHALWSSGTDNNPGAYAVMQRDGNLVVYTGERPQKPLWDTGTSGRGPSYAVIQGDGNFVVYTDAGRATWSSRSGRIG